MTMGKLAGEKILIIKIGFSVITIEAVRKLAMSFKETTEQPHFHLISFRIKNKIFCTIHEKDERIMVKLSPEDQSVFHAFDTSVIYPVPGFWGKKGATFIDLKTVRKSILKDALTVAYCTAAPKKLAGQYQYR